MQECISHVVCFFFCASSTAAARVLRVRRAFWRDCASRWRRATKRRCFSCSCHPFTSSSVITTRSKTQYQQHLTALPSVFKENSFLNITQETQNNFTPVCHRTRVFNLKGKHDTQIQLSAADLPVREKGQTLYTTTKQLYNVLTDRMSRGAEMPCIGWIDRHCIGLCTENFNP